MTRAFRLGDSALLSSEGFRVFRDCMYRPTEDAYLRKMQAYLEDPDRRVFVCEQDGRLAGILVADAADAGIVGIAVDAALRGQGIGTFLIEQTAKALGTSCLCAETDGDAVGFYRRCGFSTEKTVKYYGGEAVTRYLCRKRF